MSFDNPNLVYLEYSDVIVDKYKQVSFDSLVEANLRLRKTPDQDETDKVNVTKLLMGIHNVKILYLSDDTLEVSIIFLLILLLTTFVSISRAMIKGSQFITQ